MSTGAIVPICFAFPLLVFEGLKRLEMPPNFFERFAVPLVLLGGELSMLATSYFCQ